MEIQKLLDSFVIQSENILKDNLTGIYLHGSIAMGCFNGQKSDIDLIVVVQRELSKFGRNTSFAFSEGRLISGHPVDPGENEEAA